MDNNIKILYATENDIENIQDVLRQASKEVYEICGLSQNDFEKQFTDEPQEVNKRTEMIKNLDENEKIVVAKTEDKVIGMGHIEESSDENIVQAVYVLPEYQNKGVGLLLWNEMKKWLNPSKKTVLYVFEKNINAIKFYNKVGFNFVKNAGEHPLKNGKSISQIEMGLSK